MEKNIIILKLVFRLWKMLYSTGKAERLLAHKDAEIHVISTVLYAEICCEKSTIYNVFLLRSFQRTNLTLRNLTMQINENELKILILGFLI